MAENPNKNQSPGRSRMKTGIIASGLVVLAVVFVVWGFYRGTDSSSLSASLTGSGSLTRADCFEMQRTTGRLTPECRAILFGGSVTATAWATSVPVATADPSVPTPTPRFPMGSKCLNNDQCATGNCVMNPAIDGGPSRLIGVCGCRARPACLNSQPACALPETPDMCVCGNNQCEIGEKTTCPQDCGTSSEPLTCPACLRRGLGYLCSGGFTGGTFCNAEDGGTGADFRCVACTEEPTKCVPEGQECSTSTDCGTCGATCVGDGMTATEPPSIINGKCAYPRSSPTPPAMCDYAAPPEGCQYVPGPDYDEASSCGMVLQCPSDFPLPPAGKFRITLAETIRVGDQVDVTLCGNTVTGPFEGWATITIDAGPTADVPTHLSYEFIPEDQGCRTFPGAIQPIRTGTLKLTVHDLHFSDIDSQDPTMSETVTRTVLSDDEVACTMDAKLCPDGSYVGRTGPNCEFATCPSDTPAPGTCTELRGNVNCDERVNIADLVQLANVLAGRVPLSSGSTAYKNADTNGDGKVDIADLAVLESIVSALPSVQ